MLRAAGKRCGRHARRSCLSSSDYLRGDLLDIVCSDEVGTRLARRCRVAPAIRCRDNQVRIVLQKASACHTPAVTRRGQNQEPGKPFLGLFLSSLVLLFLL